MKRLVIYLVVTFGLSWGVWISAGMAFGTFESGVASSQIMLVLVAIGMFFPLVGALVANTARGTEQRVDLCFRPRIHGNIRFYLLAWLLPAVVTILGAALFYATHSQLFTLDLSVTLSAMTGAEVPDIDFTQMTLVLLAASVLFAPFINMFVAFGEEAGWRGMLLPLLCERMSPRMAVVVSGIIWGLWHAPIIAMGHNYGMSYPGFPVLGILSMVVPCFSLSAILSYLRIKTKSVWPAALGHGAVNAVANVGLLFCTVGVTLAGPSPLGLVAGIPLFIVALFFLMKLPPKLVD